MAKVLMAAMLVTGILAGLCCALIGLVAAGMVGWGYGLVGLGTALIAICVSFAIRISRVEKLGSEAKRPGRLRRGPNGRPPDGGAAGGDQAGRVG